MRCNLMFLCIVVCLPVICSGAVIHVPGDQPTIQAGIDASVDGDTVLVADGTFIGEGNKNMNFGGRAITVASDGGAEGCIIDCEDDGRGFYFHSSEPPEAVVEGFTIRNGHVISTGSYPGPGKGGAIYCDIASPSIFNCIFLNNTAEVLGGAVFADEGALVITGCTFNSNVSDAYGGAAYFSDNEVSLVDCIITGNFSENAGAGFYFKSCTSALIDNCNFQNNRTYKEDGGGIFSNSSTITVINSVFEGNEAAYGGGIFVSDGEVEIGGSLLTGNYFSRNFAAVGSDLAGFNYGEPVHNATFNSFAGYHLSDYYVCSQDAFDLSGCTSALTPITQDVYVKPDGSDSNDGLTWDTAFKTVHYAFSQVLGSDVTPVTIHLGPGTYSSTATGEHFPLPMLSYVSLEGSGESDTILDAENLSGVILGSRDDHVEISDLTITGGIYRWGGGVHMMDVSAVISRCTITGNTAEFGGGVGGHTMSLTMLECTVTNNTADYGGGLEAESTEKINLIDCVFSGNTADRIGGGLRLAYHNSLISNCIITDNYARYNGGGVHSGGMVLEGVFENCVFENNTTDGDGGGIFSRYEEGEIRGCTFTGNTAQRFGGAFYGEETTVVLGGSAANTNTFDNNFAGSGTDLSLATIQNPPLNATYNSFMGHHDLDYYVYPVEGFDFSHCECQLNPVTQDVYVSETGSNDNDGLSWTTAYRTIRHALSQVHGEPTNPVTVHIGSGTYSESTGEIFPFPLLPYVTLQGSGEEDVEINISDSINGFFGFDDSECIFLDLDISGSYTGITAFSSEISMTDCTLSGSQKCGVQCEYSVLNMSQCSIMNCGDSGLRLENTEGIISGSYFTGNTASESGGAIRAEQSPITVSNCDFYANEANGGGAAIYFRDSSPIVTNCMFRNNSCNTRGGGMNCWDSSPAIMNCNFLNNTANKSGGLGVSGDTVADVRNCIFWYNTEAQISGSGTALVTYSNVEGGREGEGNIDIEPGFVSGPLGDYYLDQTTSPCVDSGSAPADQICFDTLTDPVCLSDLTTAADHSPDTGTVDMGYHYSPLCAELGCTIEMPSDYYRPDDPCYCNVTVCNAEGSTLEGYPLFVILDVYGALFWGPGFTEEYDSYLMDYPHFLPGETIVTVLPAFTWPDTGTTAAGIRFIAALTNPEVTAVFGEMDTFELGWGY